MKTLELETPVFQVINSQYHSYQYSHLSHVGIGSVSVRILFRSYPIWSDPGINIKFQITWVYSWTEGRKFQIQSNIQYEFHQLHHTCYSV